VAHAAHESALGVRLEDFRAVAAIEPGLRDGYGRETAVLAQARDERHLPGRVARIPLRFHVYAALDRPSRGVREVLPGEIGAAQGAVIAVAKGDRLRVAKPGVVVTPRIPEVQVRIRDAQRRTA